VIDEGQAIHYSAVARGTPVYSADEVEVGKVDTVLDNVNEHIFDGIILEAKGGELRFVDAPEVARTAERAVTLTISAAEAEQLSAPDKAPPSYRADMKTMGKGRLSRLFGGGGWKRR
jgi:hypothetical protein